MSDTPVLLVREPWDVNRLRAELLRSGPAETIEVRTDDGTQVFRVTGYAHMRDVMRNRWNTVLTVSGYDPDEEVLLTLAGDAK